MIEGTGVPVGFVIAGANRSDSPLLEKTPEELARFGFDLPNEITVHLDAGYDSKKTCDLLDTLGCDYVITKKGEPLQAGRRWMIERTNSCRNRGFRKLQICTEKRCLVITAFIRLANSVIITRQPTQRAWTTHHWNTRPTRKP